VSENSLKVKGMAALKAEISAAVEKMERNDERMANAPEGPSTGDLYVFSATAELGIQWAIVRPHVDDAELWFMVPFDMDPFVGTWDINVPEFSDAGAGVLRCGRGIWIHTDDMRLGTRSGFLEADYVDEVKQRLAAMVHGEIVPGTHNPEVDEDPEYQEWIGEVTAAAERLESLIKAQ